MKVNVLNIRLTAEFQQRDQDNVNNFMERVTVIKTASELLSGEVNLWSVLVFYDEKTSVKYQNRPNQTMQGDDNLTEEEELTFELLKKWRMQKASEQNLSAFMICHNKHLVEIIKIKPKSLQEFESVRGLGEKKINQFGHEILEIVNR